MSPARQPDDPDRMTTLAQYGRARASLLAALGHLGEAVDAFCAVAGDRASVDVLKRVLPGAIDEIAATRGRRIDKQVFRTLAGVCERLAPAFDQAISEDIDAEAAEVSAPDTAVALRRSYHAACEARERLSALSESIGDSFYDGDSDMPDAPTARTTGSGVTGTATSAPVRSGVRYLSVADQLVASLDQLGLPHDGGALDRDEADANMAERLVRALESGFEVSNSSVGMRAKRRKRSDWSGVSQFRAGLAGSLSIDAQAIQVAADALELVLNGVQGHFRFASAGGRDTTMRAREAITEQLREIREIVARPTGLPRAQADARMRQLGKRVEDFFASLGIKATVPIYYLAVVPGTATVRPVEAPSLDELEIPATVTQAERLKAQLAEAMVYVGQIKDRIEAALKRRSMGEVAFRLERAMESAARGVVEAQMRLQSGGPIGLGRWQAIDLPVTRDSDDSAENLADGLEGALSWLRPHAERFSRPGFFADDLTPQEASDLGGELTEIANILADCVKVFPAGENPYFVSLIEGLADVTAKASELAHGLT